MFFGILFSLLTLNSGKPTYSFEEHILNSTSTKQSFYVSLLVHAKNYSGKAVIPNGILYSHWGKLHEGNQFKYRDELMKILTKNLYYEIPNENLEDYGFIKVEPDPTVTAYANAGFFRFFNHFFRKNILDVDGIKHFAAITDQLFQWKIAIQRDADTGWFIPDTDTNKYLDIKNDVSMDYLIHLK